MKICVLILSICLAIAVAGCYRGELLPHQTDLPGSNTVDAIENKDNPIKTDIPDEYEDPKESIGFSVECQNKEYGSFAEAYLDILNVNRLVLTNEQPSDEQKRMGLNIGEGQIAVRDVFGDEIPELLCLYYNGMESGLYLKILSYSEAEGVVSVFDNVVYQAIGGEHNYCVYITRDGELMLFLWSSGTMCNGGFWSIKPNQDTEYNHHSLDGVNYSRDLAEMWYVSGVEIESCGQYEEEISKDQFDIVAEEIFGNIDDVLFHGAVLGDLGLRLYKDVDLWRDITPFEADCMTYDEAVAWLKDR